MIRLIKGNSEIYLPENTKIRIKVTSPMFAKEVFPKGHSFFFNIPVEGNQNIFRNAEYVYIKDKVRAYEGFTLLFNGVDLFSEVTIFLRNTKKNVFRIAVVAKGFFDRKKNLQEIMITPFTHVVNSGGYYPASNYCDIAFDSPDWGNESGTVNGNKDDDQMGNTIENTRENSACFMYFLHYVIKKSVEQFFPPGATLEGDFFDNEEFRRLIVMNNMADEVFTDWDWDHEGLYSQYDTGLGQHKVWYNPNPSVPTFVNHPVEKHVYVLSIDNLYLNWSGSGTPRIVWALVDYSYNVTELWSSNVAEDDYFSTEVEIDLMDSSFTDSDGELMEGIFILENCYMPGTPQANTLINIHDINYSNVVDRNTLINPAHHFPNITVKDFFKEVSKAFGVCFFYDNKENKVHAEFSKDILVSGILNYSNLVTDTPKVVNHMKKTYKLTMDTANTETPPRGITFTRVAKKDGIPNGALDYGHYSLESTDENYFKQFNLITGEKELNKLGLQHSMTIGDGEDIEEVGFNCIPADMITNDDGTVDVRFNVQSVSKPIDSKLFCETKKIILCNYVDSSKGTVTNKDKDGNTLPGLLHLGLSWGSVNQGELYLKPLYEFLASSEELEYKLNKLLSINDMLRLIRVISGNSDERRIYLRGITIVPSELDVELTMQGIGKAKLTGYRKV